MNRTGIELCNLWHVLGGYRQLAIIVCCWMASSCVHSQISSDCEFDAAKQKEKSKELLQLVKDDQSDRDQPYDSIDWHLVSANDLSRRKKVAEIFAEGCFKVASDYASSAMIFQHSNTADHFYQAFVWANRAVGLGDKTQLWLTAASLDRYLVEIKHKQLFGTQFSKNEHDQWCIQQVEPSFPEGRRLEFLKKSLKDNISHVLRGLGVTTNSDAIKDCRPSLQPTPKGTVPGFW